MQCEIYHELLSLSRSGKTVWRQGVPGNVGIPTAPAADLRDAQGDGPLTPRQLALVVAVVTDVALEPGSTMTTMPRNLGVRAIAARFAQLPGDLCLQAPLQDLLSQVENGRTSPLLLCVEQLVLTWCAMLLHCEAEKRIIDHGPPLSLWICGRHTKCTTAQERRRAACLPLYTWLSKINVTLYALRLRQLRLKPTRAVTAESAEFAIFYLCALSGFSGKY